MGMIKRGCTYCDLRIGSLRGIETPCLRDMCTFLFTRSSDPLLRERMWPRVCADIYSRCYKAHDVLEPLASAASISSKSLDVELVAFRIRSTNQILNVSEKLGHGAFIVTRL